MKATTGKATKRIVLSNTGSRLNATLIPACEAQSAKTPERIAIFAFTIPDLKKLIAENVVPQPALNLLQTMAESAGSPIKRYAGKEMKPPPPAIESTKPATKTQAQIIATDDADNGGKDEGNIKVLHPYSL